MSLSMYQASVPVFLRALGNLRAVLRKGEAHAAGNDDPPEALLQTRLFPDMLPLVRQVQIATDMAVRGTARLAGAEVPSFEDRETTFAELYDRIDRACACVRGFDAAQVDGSEQREIVFNLRSGEQRFIGQHYLLDFVLPNLFFHCTTAYDILRHAGVPLGKPDFIGAPR